MSGLSYQLLLSKTAESFFALAYILQAMKSRRPHPPFPSSVSPRSPQNSQRTPARTLRRRGSRGPFYGECNPSGLGRRFWAVAPASAQNRTGETGPSGLSRKAEGYHTKAEALSLYGGSGVSGASGGISRRGVGDIANDGERQGRSVVPRSGDSAAASQSEPVREAHAVRSGSDWDAKGRRIGAEECNSGRRGRRLRAVAPASGGVAEDEPLPTACGGNIGRGEFNRKGASSPVGSCDL